MVNEYKIIKGTKNEKKEKKNKNSKDFGDNLTAKKSMDYGLEEVKEDNAGCPVLSNQNLKINDILNFGQNRNKLGELVHILPKQTKSWIIQRVKIYNRIANSNFVNWYDSKKELTSEDYANLEVELNQNEDGISIGELSTLTEKNQIDIFKDLRAGCGLSVCSLLDEHYYEFVLDDCLSVHLIPLVNEKNQLKDEIRIQYLLKAKAIKLLVEYWEYDDIVDIFCH